jgi:hypothetical protein
MAAELKFKTFEQELLNPLRGHSLKPNEEFIANTLLDASSERPMTIKDLRQAMHENGLSAVSNRMVKRIVRSLRSEHGFPILSRRGEPAGFWWCSSAEEMEGFIKLFRSQAMDELHTLSKMVKQNYPQLAGQLSLEDAA